VPALPQKLILPGMEVKKDLDEEEVEINFSLFLTIESPIPIQMEIFPHFPKDRREVVRNEVRDPNLTSVDDVDYQTGYNSRQE